MVNKGQNVIILYFYGKSSTCQRRHIPLWEIEVNFWSQNSFSCLPSSSTALFVNSKGRSGSSETLPRGWWRSFSQRRFREGHSCGEREKSQRKWRHHLSYGFRRCDHTIPARNGHRCPSVLDAPAQRSSSSFPPSSPAGSVGSSEPELLPPPLELRSAPSLIGNFSGGSQWWLQRRSRSRPLRFSPPPVSRTFCVFTCFHEYRQYEGTLVTCSPHLNPFESLLQVLLFLFLFQEDLLGFHLYVLQLLLQRVSDRNTHYLFKFRKLMLDLAAILQSKAASFVLLLHHMKHLISSQCFCLSWIQR